jgi:hypothetical protein
MDGKDGVILMSPADAETLRLLEEELLDPEIPKSSERVGRLLADDFTEIGSSGIAYDRRGIIEALQREAEGPVVGATLSDFTARSLAPDVALVTYRTTRAGQSRLRSSIWKQIQGRWLMVFHQGTPA